MTKTGSMSSKKIYLIHAIVGLVVISFIMIFGSRMIFKRNAAKTMKQTIETKTIEFNIGLKDQMALAQHMAVSPIITAYCENPDDINLREAAFAEIAAYQNSFRSHITFFICDKTCDYYFNGAYSYTLDKKADTSFWYTSLMGSGKDYEFNVDFELTQKKTFMWINAVIKSKSGKALGIIGTGIELTDYIDAMYQNLADDTTMYLYNQRLMVSGSADVAMLENPTSITKVMPALEGNELLVKDLTHISTSFSELSFAPLDTIGWYIALQQNFTFRKFIGSSVYPFSLAIILVCCYIALMFFRSIVSPLRNIKHTIERMANGNADLNTRINLKSTFNLRAIESLVESFNSFMQYLQNIISSIDESKNMLIAAGENLAKSTLSTSNSVVQITSNISNLAQNIKKQNDNVEQTSANIDEISSSIQTFDSMAVSQTQNVQSAASSISQMVENINNVTSSVEYLASSFAELSKNATTGIEQQQKVTEKILKVKEQSQMLQDANEAISAIAEQTNLLAMNAAIEAAHAGDAGKGFSVVADEIRKLSESSSEQSKTIGNQLKTIQESINLIVDLASASQNILEGVSRNITSTNNAINGINSKMAEQKSGSSQINFSLESLNSSSLKVQQSSSMMSEKNTQALQGVHNLQNESLLMQESMSKITDSVKVMEDAKQTMLSVGNEMESSIRKLGEQISKFRM